MLLNVNSLRMKCKILSFLICSVLIGLFSCTEDSDVSLVGKNDVSTRATRGFYTYPSVSEILKQDVVKRQMEAAWSKMKSSAGENARYEFGFFIYKKQLAGEYYVGDIVQGDKVEGCEGTNASISLGVPTSNIDVCAFFHCHTTLQYCPETNSRETGPSQSDISYANIKGLPGILYDYSDSRIYGGHDKNAPCEEYTFGPTQKPDMPY